MTASAATPQEPAKGHPADQFDQQARQVCTAYSAGRIPEQEARGRLQEIFLEAAVTEPLIAKCGVGGQQFRDSVDATNRGMLDRISGHAKPFYDLNLGCEHSFIGWCRKVGRLVARTQTSRLLEQQRRTEPHPDPASDLPSSLGAPTADERLRLISDELADRAASRRGLLQLRADALISGLRLPEMTRLSATVRDDVTSRIDNESFVEVAMTSFLLAGKVTTCQPDSPALAMVGMWAKWQPAAVHWFISEYGSEVVRDSVELLARSVLEPLPRPSAVKLRRAAVELRRRHPDPADLRYYADVLVREWVDHNCGPNEQASGRSSEREQKLARLAEKIPQPWNGIDGLLRLVEERFGVPAGDMAARIEESLAAVGSWPNPFCDDELKQAADRIFAGEPAEAA